MNQSLIWSQPEPSARAGVCPCRWLVLLLAASLAGSARDRAGAAFQSPGTSTPDKKAPAAAPQPAGKGLDGLKLPTDALILVCESAADAMRLLPKFVVLSPEKFKEMQDEIERLRARLRPERPQQPGFCKLEGKVDGSHVNLDVRYAVRTERPETVVALGCKQAKLKGLLPEDQNSLVKYTEAEGYTVQMEKAGEHRLTARYTMGLTVLGSTRSLELDLPRAGIELKLHIPGEVKELRINDQPLDKTLLTWKNGWLEGTHGPGVPERLVLTWKGSTALAGGSAVLSAESKIKVQIDEKMQLHTETQLLLKVVSGSTKQWRLLVPPGAQLTLASADEEKLTIETQELAGASLRILRLKEPGASPLTVTVVAVTRPALPRAGTRLAIGPFALLGATRQTGSVVLVNAAANLQFQPFRPAGTTLRAPTPEESKLGPQVRAFSYELPPLSETPPFLDRGDLASLNILELEGETTRGRLETRVSHSLHLPRKEAPGEKRNWQITTILEVKLLQPGAGLLEVQLPADWVYVPPEGRPPEPVTEVYLDEKRQVIQVRLLPDSWKPFQLVLRARSSRQVDDRDEDKLSLPRPLGTALAGGFQVTASVPEELELLSPQRKNTQLEPTQQGPQEQVWRLDPAADRTPEQIELAWGPYRPRVQALSVIDLKLIGPQAQIEQDLRLLYPRTPPEKMRIALRVPAEVSGLGVIKGGTLLDGPPGGATRLVELNVPERNRPEKEVKLVLQYFLTLPDPASRKPDDPPVRLALVTAGDSTFGETQVRLWSDPGLVPELVGGDWAIKEIQEVKGAGRLPSLVLLSHQPEQELNLRLGSSGTAGRITVLIERALVRVNVVEGLGQIYRASYRLSRLSRRQIEVELPAPAETLHLRIKLDGQTVTPQIHDDPDIPEGEGRLARLDLDPALIKPESILDISYQLPPASLTGRGGLMQTVLLPPVVRGAPTRVLTRWQVNVPAGWVVVGPEGGPGSERTWGRRGLLLAPRLAITGSELDRWLVAPDGTLPRDVASEEAEWPMLPSLTCWRGGPEPLTVVHLPQQAWLLFCSLFVLLLGLVVGFLARRPAKESFSPVRIGLALALLGLVAVIAGVFWPSLLAAILYGCQPGLVVLGLIILVQWLLHERHRRQLVFLPSFTRRGGSSLNSGNKTGSGRRGRNGSASPGNQPASVPGRAGSPPAEQPSTIDEPRPG